MNLRLDATIRFEESVHARAGGTGGREPEWTLEAREFADGVMEEILAEQDDETPDDETPDEDEGEPEDSRP